MSSETRETDAACPSTATTDLQFFEPDPTVYPRLVPGVSPIGGRIRETPEDFCVEEIPLYPCSGKGEHCYVTVVKRNRTTLEVREYLAKSLRVSEESVGFAGFKDRRAVARQTFSIPGIESSDLHGLERSWLEIGPVTHHTNKLRTGHLRGNRFRIRIRGVRPGAGQSVEKILSHLEKTGVPNFFGPQRFGYFGDSFRVGRALLSRDPHGAISALLAPRPQEADAKNDGYRQLYAAGRFQDALEALPPGRRTEAAILHTLRRYPGNYRAAARRIPRQVRRMFFSAYQGFLFNWCLRERLEWGLSNFGEPMLGDLAYLHRNGATFLVEDLEEARARAATGEISPSGPIFGRRMAFPNGREGEMERQVLAVQKLRPQSFLSHVKGLKLNGSRRSYRVLPQEVDWCEEGDDTIVLSFSLPSGSYATLLLEQLMGVEGGELSEVPDATDGEDSTD